MPAGRYIAPPHLAEKKIKVDPRPPGLEEGPLGLKYDDGKIMAGVLTDFSRALTAVAEVGTFGANKYARSSWQHVDNRLERYTDAMWRHLLKEPVEPVDDESGLLHAAHMAWGALARLEIMLEDAEAGECERSE